MKCILFSVNTYPIPLKYIYMNSFEKPLIALSVLLATSSILTFQMDIYAETPRHSIFLHIWGENTHTNSMKYVTPQGST